MTTIARTMLLAIALTACSSQNPTHADPTGGGSVADKEGVITRFTNDIWPAVEGYRAPGQGSPNSKRFWSVLDSTLPVDSYGGNVDSLDGIRDAAFHLGKVGDAITPQSFPDGNGLHLVRASVSSLNGADAAVVACYTFTSLRMDAPTDPGTPTTSEATFGLHKTDNWYLRSITNDHVVPGCSSMD